MLGTHMLQLTHADAMFTGAGATHTRGAFDHALVDLSSLFQLHVVVRVEKHGRMKITITDMTDDGREQSGFSDICLGFVNAFGELRNRYTDVGDISPASRFDGEAGIVSIVTCTPELPAVFFLFGPLEVTGTQVA